MAALSARLQAFSSVRATGRGRYDREGSDWQDSSCEECADIDSTHQNMNMSTLYDLRHVVILCCAGQ